MHTYLWEENSCAVYTYKHSQKYQTTMKDLAHNVEAEQQN